MKKAIEFSFLKQIQNYVIKYANVISEVLDVDIEIVDDNLMRVAGTGSFNSMVDKICEGISYKNVLETGEHKIILEPSKDSCCEYCKFKISCKEVLEIATPVFYNEKIIGVIGLICLDESQRTRILKNLEENVRFLDNIAELISSKVYEEFKIKGEYDFINFLEVFISNINTAVVILGDNGKIEELNDEAIKELYGNSYNSSFDLEKNNFFDYSKYKNRGHKVPINMGNYKEIFIFDNKKRVKDEVENIIEEKKKLVGVERLVGSSKKMLDIKSKVSRIASSTSTVLITGESGTGKEVLARAIHEASDRRDKPFIAINCAAIPESLLESELLGYAKGAFSGASAQGRVGKFELANTGVIFLDEIGDMPLNLQAKILRVIQDRRCIRIGSNKVIDLDIRIIAATNKDLKKMVEEKKFREDLYYRLNVIPMALPALRERENDLKLLIESILEKYIKILKKDKKLLSEKVLDKMMAYNWPGNIRELENAIEYMVNISGDSEVLTEEFLPDSIQGYLKSSEQFEFVEEELTLNQLENKYIAIMIDKYGSDLKAKKLIADKLGIGIATLYRKIDKLMIGKEN